MKPFTDADRPAILNLLKLRGPLNAPTLADSLGVNPTAVRQQLAVLHREGLVSIYVERRQVGRPTHLFQLTEKAEALFPQAYGPFALSVLKQLVRMDGRGKVIRVFARRTRELLGEYRKRLAGLTSEQKIRELATIRDEEGYMADSTGSILVEHHCPIAAIAKEFPEVCQYEQRLFESAVGLKLTRSEHIASGGHACIYQPERNQISKLGKRRVLPRQP
jgi:predicted ArsR family transcriptional regulator